MIFEWLNEVLPILNWELMWDSLPDLLAGVPLTLALVVLSLSLGICIAFITALTRLYGPDWLKPAASLYILIFRGTPLLVQLFLVYYGLGQFEAVRDSALWIVLRSPFWCAVLAMALNTGAYTSEIIRGAILSIPLGQVEAARACGMSRILLFRRVIAPIAIRQALPAYSNEMILMVKASSLASIITLLEITGIAKRIMSETYAVFEILLIAGAIYLAINYAVTRLVRWAEFRLTPYLRARVKV
jgi:octopine/nopaline transport system permease protein